MSNAYLNTTDIIDLMNNEGLTSFAAILDSNKAITSTRSVFHYMFPCPIEGRQEELGLLDQFVESQDDFLFWGITGRGGIGKSKLAYHFLSIYESNPNWKMCFISSEEIQLLSEISEFFYSKNVLLVFDYAGAHAEQIGKIIRNLIRFFTDYNPGYKCRILLLERQSFIREDVDSNNPVYLAPEWYQKMMYSLDAKRAIDSTTFELYRFLRDRYPCMLSLEESKMSNDDLFSIMDQYARRIKKETLSEEQKSNILFNLNKHTLHPEDNRGLAPLYVLFATDAILNGDECDEWNRGKLIENIYNKNIAVWKDQLNNQELFNALYNVVIYSTIIKRWNFNSSLFEPIIDSEGIIKKNRNSEREDPAYEWVSLFTEKTIHKSGSPYMTALEPDIIGEFFVLDYFRKKNDADIGLWCKELLNHPQEINEFLFRCIEDYADIYNDTIIRLLKQLSLKIDCMSADALNLLTIVAVLWRHFHSSIFRDYKYFSKYHSESYYFTLKNIVKEVADFSHKWDDKFQICAELHAYILHYQFSNKNQIEDKYFAIRKLYSMWPKSPEISKMYLEIIPAVAGYYLGKSNYKSELEVISELYSIIEDCIREKDSDFSVECAASLAKITTYNWKYYINDTRLLPINKLRLLIDELDEEFFIPRLITEYKKIILSNDEKVDKQSAFRFLTEVICNNIISNNMYYWDVVKEVTNICTHYSILNDLKTFGKMLNSLYEQAIEIDKCSAWALLSMIGQILQRNPNNKDLIDITECVRKDLHDFVWP